MEDEGEVPVEGAGEVGARQLARVGVGAEDVAGVVVGPRYLGDGVGRGVPDELQQGDPAFVWRWRRRSRR